MAPAATLPKRLRILLVVNLHWDARLGAVRVHMELAERWRAAGHFVEHFSLSEAFPNARPSRAGFAVRQVLFAYKAAAFVRRNADRFDIVDAVMGSLRGSKKQLRFRGLLVARSVGLLRLYQRFEPRAQDQQTPRRSRGKLTGRILYTLIQKWFRIASDSAVVQADLINVPNEDEAICLREEIDPDLEIVVQPYGLTMERREALEQSAIESSDRLSRKNISFIGMWGPRKGSFDWANIVRQIWHTVPDAHFRFLGTMVPAETIFADLGLRSSERVELIPEYASEDLSKLLADCTVGIFPSYVEGFGLAILEQLAAGIPTVAFDVPGPRHILTGVSKELLTPAGDVSAMAERALEILRMDPAEYVALSERCRSIARKFQWEQIAEDTANQYRTALAKRGRIVFTEPFGLTSAGGGGGGRILRSLLRDAPLPTLSVCTSPEKPEPKHPDEIHLPVRPNFGRIERTRFLPLPHALAPLFQGRFMKRLERVCRDACARAVHAIAHGGVDFHHAYRAARKLGVPYFLQVHDDAVYTSGGRAPAKTMSRCLAEAWLGADARFVISNELGAEYNKRYGERAFTVVTDGVDQITPAPRPAPKNLRIYFMGLFHLEYEPNLQSLIEAVDLVGKELGGSTTRSITLRCGAIRSHLQHPSVRILPFASEADVQADLVDADWLYLPLPFDEAHRAFVAYSLSTKMVTYLGSGIPILYHGPLCTAAYNLLSKNRAAALMTSLDANEIARTLVQLVRDANSSALAANALELARRNFLRREQHDKFWSEIVNCLKRPRPDGGTLQ